MGDVWLADEKEQSDAQNCCVNKKSFRCRLDSFIELMCRLKARLDSHLPNERMERRQTSPRATGSHDTSACSLMNAATCEALIVGDVEVDSHPYTERQRLPNKHVWVCPNVGRYNVRKFGETFLGPGSRR